MRTVQPNLKDLLLDYEMAKSFSDLEDSQLSKEFMIVAWYDGQNDVEHPSVPECQHKPGWQAYADGHGGEIKVDINGGEFIFIYSLMEGDDEIRN